MFELLVTGLGLLKTALGQGLGQTVGGLTGLHSVSHYELLELVRIGVDFGRFSLRLDLFVRLYRLFI